MSGSSGFWQRRLGRAKKTAETAYLERRRRRERQVTRDAPLPVTVGRVADRDRLYEAYQTLREEGGPGPGVDGVTYADLSNSEAARLLGGVSEAIMEDDYAPQPARRVRIPKPGSTGVRELRLGTIVDRTVAKSLLMAMEPHAEKLFLPCSWGYRPGRSSWGMLLAIERAVTEDGRAVVVNADIKTAFDCVRVDQVIDCHGEMIRDWEGTEDLDRRASETGRLLRLVRVVLGGDGVGIPQGNPYSPLCLNLLLTRWLDGPLTATMNPPAWLRYADNLVLACHTVNEGRRFLRDLRRRLAPLGMVLKDGADVTDLRAGGVTEVLGLTLRLRDKVMAYGLGNGAIDHLRERLTQAHREPHASEAAEQILLSWVQSCGPALESDGDVLERISRTLSSLGFHHLSDRRLLAREVTEARNRWRSYRGTHGRPRPD